LQSLLLHITVNGLHGVKEATTAGIPSA